MDYFEYITKYNEIFDRMRELPYGEERYQLADELARFSDRYDEPSVQFHARLCLVSSATFTGKIDRALVAFAWLLGTYDEDPETHRDYSHSLLWRYKWMVGNLADFPNFSREQIMTRFDDIERRFRNEGYNLRAYWQARGWYARSIRDYEGLAEALTKRNGYERDEISDCLACEQNFDFKVRLCQGEKDAALEAARPLIDGEMSCENVPNGVYAWLLDIVDDDTAIDYHRRGWRLIEDRVDSFNEAFRKHVVFELGRDPDLARKRVEENLARCRNVTPYARTQFYAGALRVFDETGEELLISGGKDLCDLNEGVLDSSAADEMRAELQRLVEAFDERNGNTRFSAEFDDVL